MDQRKAVYCCIPGWLLLQQLAGSPAYANMPIARPLTLRESQGATCPSLAHRVPSSQCIRTLTCHPGPELLLACHCLVMEIDLPCHHIHCWYAFHNMVESTVVHGNCNRPHPGWSSMACCIFCMSVRCCLALLLSNPLAASDSLGHGSAWHWLISLQWSVTRATGLMLYPRGLLKGMVYPFAGQEHCPRSVWAVAGIGR